MATEIGLKLTADSTQAAKSINDLQTELKAAKKDFNDAKIGSEEYTAAQKKVKEATDELTKAQGGSSDAFGVLKEKIMSTVPGLQAAETGTKSFGTALKALAANPIVLILTAVVAALSLLYAAFTNTMAGAQKMEAVFSGMKASLTVIVDRLTTFGNAIIKVFSGDFKGAAEDAKAAFTGVGDTIGSTFNRAKTIQEGLQRIRQEERDDAKDKANRLARLATIREMLNDESISVAEKKKLAKELKEASDKNNTDDLDRQKRKTAFEIELIKMKKNLSEEDINEINKKEIEVEATAREGKMEGVRINKVVRNLGKQESAERLAEIAKEKAAEKERLSNIREYKNKIDKLKEEEELSTIDDTFKKEQKQLDIKLKDDLAAAKLSLEEKKITQDQYNALEVEYRKLTVLKIAEVDRKAVEDFRKRSEENQKKIQEFEDKLREDLEKIKQAKELKKKNDDVRLIESEMRLLKSKHQLTIAAEFDLYNQKRAIERQYLVDHQATNDELLAFDNDTSIARVELTKQEGNIRKEELGSIGKATEALSELVGKDTAAGKELAMASALINTYQGVTEALKQKSTLPSPFDVIAKVANVATVLATGLKAVKSIASVSVPGGGGSGGGSASSMSMSAPVTPSASAVQSSVLSPESLNAINGTTSRAYVLESDVTNNQQRISRINRAARLG
jgi:hypothetical protein